MFPKKLRNVYHFGDALVQMKLIPDKSVDLVFTSCPDLSQTDFGKQVGDYKSFQREAVDEMSRIVKDTGFLIICQTDRKLDGKILANHIWYHRCATRNGLELKDIKAVIRNPVPKGRATFQSVEDAISKRDLYHIIYQNFLCFTRKGTFERKGEILRSVLVDNQHLIGNQHVWSQDFCKLIINAYSQEGDVVIDPFAGVGPVLKAAKDLKRIYFGCELAEHFYNTDFTRFKLK